jgi:FKBP-type peptidyl-prolyl cis-trans isomerase FkpA
MNKKTSVCLWIILLILCAATAHARAIREDFRKADEKALLSYAFGMAVGSNLRTAGVEFDYDAFARGLKAIIEDSENSLLSEQEAVDMVETALYNAMDKRLEESRINEEYFLAENMEKPGIQSTSSGLQYEILHEGSGDKPEYDSVVRVHYEGKLIDGTVFDDSYADDEEGVLIPLDRVIPGWTEGILLMSIGSKYRLYIPSRLAYGRNGAYQVIPPYAPLIFTVELLEIISPEDNEEF